MTEDPHDPYLWDGSGEPDEELRELERLLARFRYEPVLPGPFDAAVSTPDEDPERGS